MKRIYFLLSTFLLVFLFQSNIAAQSSNEGSSGIDQIFKKPETYNSWGQQFRTLFNQYTGRSPYDESYALIVGVSKFDHFNHLPTENDPIKMKDHLLQYEGFDYVHLLTEEKVTASRIRQLMEDEFPSLVKQDDRFLFYWSGHGVTRTINEGKRGYLPVKKSQPEKFFNMINMEDVQDWDKLLKAKQTLYLLDACFSGFGYITQSGLANTQTEQTIKQIARFSRHIMTAGTENQQTIAIDLLGGSVFTAAILDGLKGNADLGNSSFPQDGVISLRELEIHVNKYVAQEVREVHYRDSITPQVRNLANNIGQFFFISDEYKRDSATNSNSDQLSAASYGEYSVKSDAGQGEQKSKEFSYLEVTAAQKQYAAQTFKDNRCSTCGYMKYDQEIEAYVSDQVLGEREGDENVSFYPTIHKDGKYRLEIKWSYGKSVPVRIVVDTSGKPNVSREFQRENAIRVNSQTSGGAGRWQTITDNLELKQGRPRIMITARDNASNMDEMRIPEIHAIRLIRISDAEKADHIEDKDFGNNLNQTEPAPDTPYKVYINEEKMVCGEKEKVRAHVWRNSRGTVDGRVTLYHDSLPDGNIVLKSQEKIRLPSCELTYIRSGRDRNPFALFIATLNP